MEKLAELDQLNKPKTIFFGGDKAQLSRIYGADYTEKTGAQYKVLGTFSKAELLHSDAEVMFCTWGVEPMSSAEIDEKLPNLKYLFYAGGSVKAFAEAYLKRGIRIFSARAENAEPVADFTVASIIMALKGALRRRKRVAFSENCGGIYGAKIGLIGMGLIGTGVAERLKSLPAEVLVYDPYLTEERATALNVKRVDLAEIFSTCNVISNHLPDLDDLVHVLNERLFKLMKSYSTFINTGRGRQVDERALVRAMRADRTRTALLDVTHPEPPSFLSPLRNAKNIILTPHIAGSLGNEVRRMGDAMLSTAEKVLREDASATASTTAPTPDPHEITLESLKYMA